MDCVFCRIAAKELPAHTICDDGRTCAFLDIQPRVAGHAVVIPKMHAVTLLDLPENEVGSLFAAVKAVTALIEKSLHPDGFTIGINHGNASGQTVKHLHVHIIPRWNDDGGGSIHSVVKGDQRQPPIEEVYKKIMAHA